MSSSHAAAAVEAVPLRLACLSQAPFNPYLELLYSHLAEEGVERVPGGTLSVRWLLGHRKTVDVLHIHWPEGLWRFRRGPARLRPYLSWLKLAFFAIRIHLARALGYRIAWTIHQVAPHEQVGSGLDLIGARILASAADVLVTHDETTAEDARRRLGSAAERIVIVPHGSYVGVYPPGRDRQAVRDDLGLGPETFAFLAFGELRGYKSVDLLLEGFTRAAIPDAALVIAGNPKDRSVAETVRVAAAADPRIHPLLDFVPVAQVAELFSACDAAVLARGDGGTSGSLILALSMGSAVVAADTASYRSLTGDGAAGWLFRAGDADSLRAALEEAAHDPDAASRRARAAEQAERLDWQDTARTLSALLRDATTSQRRRTHP